MKIGLSYVSVANAKANLDAENRGWDFAGVRAQADRIWNDRLNSIRVAGGTLDAKKKFYTALYHALWAPSIFSDVNGQYIGFDNTVHQVAKGQQAQYSSFSGWDIYRSLIQLKSILNPSETSDMIQSLINDADQCGAIPHWVNDNVEDGVMPGDAGSLIVSNAYAFGARRFDTRSALQHMVKMANIPGTACNNVTTNGGRASYLQTGYITNGEWGQASSTLEYTSSDFAISRFAGALGDTATQRMLLSRSAYWQNLLDTTLTPPLIAARQSNGAWIPETPSSGDNYVEGNAEQYTWMVPYNGAGLFAQLGGNAAVTSRLDQFFTVLNAGLSLPNFYMGNEPTFEVPWLQLGRTAGGHAARGAADPRQRVRYRPRRLAGQRRPRRRVGLVCVGCAGPVSADPRRRGLAIGSPQFPQIDVRLGNGRTWRIRAEGAPASNYVQSLSINGRAHDVPWVAYDDIANGATLHFAMGSTPSQWGSRKQPPSFGVPVAVNAVDSYNNRGFSADGATNADGRRGLRRQPVQLLAECAGSGGRAARQAVRGGRRERRGGGRAVLARQHRDRRPDRDAAAGIGRHRRGGARLGQQWPEQRHGAAEFCRRFESGGHAGLRRLDAEWRQRARQRDGRRHDGVPQFGQRPAGQRQDLYLRAEDSGAARQGGDEHRAAAAGERRQDARVRDRDGGFLMPA